MWYFAYGHDMNWRSLAEWADLHGMRPPPQRGIVRAVTLPNHRLAFPRFSEYWGGGVADVVPEPGKSVAGALIHISPRSFELLQRMHNRATDGRGREVGEARLIDVNVTPYKGGERIAAVAFRSVAPEDGHVPPTRQYISRMVESALELDLSAMWVMQLRSFVLWNDSERADAEITGRVPILYEPPKERKLTFPPAPNRNRAGGRVAI